MLFRSIKAHIEVTVASISVLLVGCIVSFVVSVFAIRYLMQYIRKHDFKVFGVYRIILGVIVLLFYMLNVIQ